MTLKISVLTPCKNAQSTLGRAIASVQNQSYSNWEHIVVDGGSSDGSIDFLKACDTVDWISEPDAGQTHAMQKAFLRSCGDIIVYLNADDYFLPGAFDVVVEEFNKGANFVVGNVLVKSGRGGFEFINKPHIELKNMLRHWKRDAFCYNPVGYFYLRQVQEACPFNLSNNETMDLEFLLLARSKFDFVKIEKLLGCYNDDANTKTHKSQISSNYWTTKSFPYLEGHLSLLSTTELKKFRREQARGYKWMRIYWHIMELRRKLFCKTKVMGL